VAQARLVAEKIRLALSEPYVLTVKRDGRPEATVEHRCTASIGLALFIGQDVSQDEILKKADTAMYHAKDAGRNSLHVAPEHSPEAGTVTDMPASFVRLVWHSSYQSGNAVIDDQHRRLFAATNDLLGAILSGRQNNEITAAIETLLKETARHFDDEEVVFTQAGFPGAAEHAASHRQLIDSATALVDRFRAGTLDIGDLFQFLARDMVARHMLGADRDFFPYLRNQRRSDPPSSKTTEGP
jgi:hemerythrin-like metal-binding protein